MKIVRLNWDVNQYPRDLLELFQKEKRGYWKVGSNQIQENQNFLFYSVKSNYITGIIGFGKFARGVTHSLNIEEREKYRLDLVTEGPKKDPKANFAELNFICLNLDSLLVTIEEITQRFGRLSNFAQQGSQAINAKYQPEAYRLYQELDVKYNNEIIKKDLSDIERRLKGLPTEKITEITQRVGQGWLRKKLLSIYSGKCQISDECDREFLVCSHIVPWRDDEENRLNPNNALLLAFNYDFFFDKGYISFSDDGTIIISSKIKDIKDKYGIKSELKLKGLKEESKIFLKRHRETIFKK